MKKRNFTLFICVMLMTLAFVSCVPTDVPENGENTNSAAGSDADGDNVNTNTNNDVEKNFIVVDDKTDIPVLPHEGAPDYYVYYGTVYKIFYSFDELSSFVSVLTERGAEFIRQCIGFNFESNDYMQVWVFEGTMSDEQYETFITDNKAAIDIDYINIKLRYPNIYSCVIYRDKEKHSSGREMDAFFNQMAYENHTRPALFETWSHFYASLEGFKDDPNLSHLLETVGLIPENYKRELISFAEEKGVFEYNYTFYYGGKEFAYINSCEKLSDEFINMLLDGMVVIG